jgi:hypothetical protein
MGAIPQDGGSPAIELLALLTQLVEAMEEAKTYGGLCGCVYEFGFSSTAGVYVC